MYTIEKYTPSNFMMDYNAKLKIDYLVEIIQSLGEIDSKKYGIDNKSVMEKGFAWILISQGFEIINELPTYNDTIIVKTWNSGTKGVKFFRENLVYKNEISEENLFLKNSSEWIIVDSKTHFPKKPSEIFDIKLYKDKLDLSKALEYKTPSVKNINKSDSFCTSYKVQLSDLDSNIHFHNVDYIKLCINKLAEFENLNPNNQHLQIKNFSITYKAEIKLGEEVKIFIKKIDDYVFLEGVLDENNTSFIAQFNYKIK